ncbi:MAG TPA: hypothetical protein PLK48_06425 [Caldisericia bacterium]|nr:hypothetical protein [Caldisericia bacterium]HON83869.1 hypothetical protein [Caldisericia bacterium]
MNEDFLEKEYYKILSDYVKIKLENDSLKKDIKNKNKLLEAMFNDLKRKYILLRKEV